jgi:hypothetical protein
MLLPSPVLGAGGWSVSASSKLVNADFISTSGSNADLYLENNVSFEPFGLAQAGAVLDALGFGGGYSQEVSWSSGGPAVSCPKGLADLFSFCSTDASGGWALIPDSLRTELSLSASDSASRSLDVRPSIRSLAYDGTVAAIGIALETLSPGPIVSNAAQVASLALQLLPEAAGFEAAMERKDYTAAGFELLSLSKRAMTIIADHITDWAIGGIVDLIPGLAEVKLGIAISKAIVVLGNLDTHLLAGYSVTTVTVGYGGGGGAPAQNAGTFSPTGSMTTARQNQTATLLSDGRVLTTGGHDDSGALASAEMYDPKSGTYAATGSMNVARDFQTATLLADGRVLIAGGTNANGNLATAEVYDSKSGTFTPTGSMTTARDWQTATLLPNGRVLIAGGVDANGNVLASAELYDATTGTFSPTGTMASPRGLHTATLLSDGRVLVVGGLGECSGGGCGSPLASAEVYDPKSGTFTPTGSMTTARHWHTATLLSNGRVLIAGGDSMDLNGHGLASAEVYDPSVGTFSPTGSMTTPRYDHTATLLADGSVLIAGGEVVTKGDASISFLAAAELYDPKSGTFTPTGSMTERRSWHTATLLLDGRVLIVGGWEGSRALASAELYRPVGASGGTAVAPMPTPARNAGAFSPTGSLVTARFGETVTLLQDGRVLIAGGDNAGTAELYDPRTGLFSPTGSMTAVRDGGHTATLLSDGRVLIAGGSQPDGSSGFKALASAELYDPATGKFSPTGSMTIARTGHTATLLSDGRVLIAGGGNGNSTTALPSAELYEPKTGRFTGTGSMTTARVLDTATLLSDGRVLFVGGGKDTASPLSSAELYDPKAGTFSATGSMTTARESCTATLLANGRVLVAGGFAIPPGYLASAELYDPKTGTFSATGSMTDSRSDHTATRLQDGRVLIAGGQHDGGPVASAELYDQATGTFSPTGSMATKREFPISTVLSDGRVLIVGPYPDSPDSLTSAELYAP